MTKRLTAKAVENARPKADRYELSDGGSGLRVVVYPSGQKSWVLRYRRPPPDKRTAKLKFDGVVTLAGARKAAADALHELAQGRDPGALKFESKATAAGAAAARDRDTVEHLAAQFVELHAKRKTRPNSWRQAVHVFENIVLPEWRGRTVHDIRRRDIIDLLESVAVDRPIMANRVHSYVSKFCSWLCERDVIAASPMVGVKPPSQENVRDRVLSDRELVALWRACDAVDEPARSWVRMLVLLGQRRSEVAGMRRSEIEGAGDLWRIPADRMKGRAVHLLPLPARALVIIDTMPKTDDLVFTVGGKAPLGHLERVKRAIDAKMKPAAPWVWHDIRRTVATGMAGLGVAVPTIEKILAHRSGTFRGIVGTYQRHSFIPEMRSALERWSEHVDRLMQGVPASKVVPIGRR
jgi:integrase